jgi:hypothetical protein
MIQFVIQLWNFLRYSCGILEEFLRNSRGILEEFLGLVSGFLNNA